MVEAHARIGVAGPSCSGKSTLARMLASRLGARHLCLDDFYAPAHPRRFVDDAGEPVRSFEHPCAYDGAALLREAAETDGPVVAEGFLLFAYEGALERFDLCVFVDLPWSEVRRRRSARRGQTTSKVDASFERVGEREWLRFGAPQAGMPGVVVLDGQTDPTSLADRVDALIHPLGARRV